MQPQLFGTLMAFWVNGGTLMNIAGSANVVARHL